jgi:hypothetical protein
MTGNTDPYQRRRKLILESLSTKDRTDLFPASTGKLSLLLAAAVVVAERRPIWTAARNIGGNDHSSRNQECDEGQG